MFGLGIPCSRYEYESKEEKAETRKKLKETHFTKKTRSEVFCVASENNKSFQLHECISLWAFLDLQM